jgi:hypothetical protein
MQAPSYDTEIAVPVKLGTRSVGHAEVDTQITVFGSNGIIGTWLVSVSSSEPIMEGVCKPSVQSLGAIVSAPGIYVE